MDVKKNRDLGAAYNRLSLQNLVLRVTYVALGTVVAFVYISQLDLSHFQYWRPSRTGSGTIAVLAIPAAPYFISAIFAWNFATPKAIRAVMYFLMLFVSSALVCKLYLDASYHHVSILERISWSSVQCILYMASASWAFENYFGDD